MNIPPTLNRLPEGFSGKEEETGGEYEGIKEGNNDWKVPGRRGPKLLYALDEEMNLGNKVRGICIYIYMMNEPVIIFT